MHTSDSSYLDIFRKNERFKNKCDAELELMLSSSKYLYDKIGLGAHHHRKRGMEMLFPNRIWHEWRDQRIRSVQECLDSGTQELSWIGSSNSNKSADVADTVISLWLTKPEMTTAYIASPFEDSTETGIMSYIREQFTLAKDNNPSLPGKYRKTDSSIVHHDRNPRSFIRVATVDQIGKLVGKKAISYNEGFIILVLDELPAFSESAARNLIKVIWNLRSNRNLLILATGNFAHLGDALGILCDPDERDIPGGYDGFDPDIHHRWRTKRKGLVLRFDGLQSPNVIAGRDYLPFVTTIAYINDFASRPGGLKTPEAMRFVRSAPVTNITEFTVTTREKIKAGGGFDPYTWTQQPLIRFSFTDPGFGGDPCVHQKFKLGFELLPGGTTRQILAFWDEPVIFPIQIGLVEDGEIITPEVQIVRAVKAHNKAHHIPDNHVAYDGSMRSGIVQAFGVHYSLLTQPFDSEGPATSRPVSARDTKEDGKPLPWKEKVDRLVSEFWFAVALAIDSKQIRGFELSPKAVEQFTSRQWKHQGKKKRLQTKDEYKDMLREQGKPVESPNEADCLAGGVEFARRLGFNLLGFTPEGGISSTLLELIKHRQAKAGLAMARNVGAPLRLPSGSLQGMSRGQASRPSGTLYRQ